MAHSYSPLIVNRALTASLLAIETRTVRDEVARHSLGRLLQSALQLEFATIPPYLSAAFSLDTRNGAIQQLLARVAREEMLHMTAVANIMNAIGVAPDILAAVPVYPHDLAVLDPPLRLDLRSFSLDLVKDLLMMIEAPEHPIVFPMAVAERPRTIGQFYAAIIEIIDSDTIPGLFDNAERDAYKQVEVAPNFQKFAYADNLDDQSYPLKAEIDFLIKDKVTAVRHLKWIVDQGEGAEPLDPLTAEGIPGHFYRLESILRSRYLVPDSNADLEHSFKGADLSFDTAGVHDFDVNSKLADYASHQHVARQMKRFNENYTEMMNALQAAFNCPSAAQKGEALAAYERALGNMRNMPNIATAIVRKARESGIKAGMPFEYGQPAAA